MALVEEDVIPVVWVDVIVRARPAVIIHAVQHVKQVVLAIVNLVAGRDALLLALVLALVHVLVLRKALVVVVATHVHQRVKADVKGLVPEDVMELVLVDAKRPVQTAVKVPVLVNVQAAKDRVSDVVAIVSEHVAVRVWE